ncbi:hypothetical protein HRD49_10975 [Corallococcus exiguus]|uniref:hypothetical protein n=1 Tax=Corallococcus exiguus TaxID=83462 RepID=UPI001560D6BC|nr:hypothetical protein [Corallococcus exiguus]NRD62267.1 hypothetical protein [Corallococcus exiguus]
MTNSISDIIQEEEWKNPDLLTPLRTGKTLLIATDYGGDHAKTAFGSLSFLVADLELCSLWEGLRVSVRRQFLRDSRRMAFKHLRDKRRADALIPFLRSADNIPGLLATFLFDRRLKSIFKPDRPGEEPSPDLSPKTWNPKVFEKLCRIGHIGGLLINGLSAEHQNVIWITDEDEIAPNTEQHRKATILIGHFASHYCSHQLGHFRFGTTKSDSGKLDLEDLVSVPDLAAGATAEIMNGLFKANTIPQGAFLIPPSKTTSNKALKIAGWMAKKDQPLKRMTFFTELVSLDRFKTKLLQMTSD